MESKEIKIYPGTDDLECNWGCPQCNVAIIGVKKLPTKSGSYRGICPFCKKVVVLSVGVVFSYGINKG